MGTELAGDKRLQLCPHLLPPHSRSATKPFGRPSAGWVFTPGSCLPGCFQPRACRRQRGVKVPRSCSAGGEEWLHGSARKSHELGKAAHGW